MIDEPDIITINEKEYKIAGLTQEIQSKFEKYWHHYDLSTIESNKSTLSKDSFTDLLMKHLYDVKMGAKSVGTNAFYQFVSYYDHLTELLSYCIGKYNNIDRKELRKWVETEAALPVVRKLMGSKKN